MYCGVTAFCQCHAWSYVLQNSDPTRLEVSDNISWRSMDLDVPLHLPCDGYAGPDGATGEDECLGSSQNGSRCAPHNKLNTGVEPDTYR